MHVKYSKGHWYGSMYSFSDIKINTCLLLLPLYKKILFTSITRNKTINMPCVNWRIYNNHEYYLACFHKLNLLRRSLMDRCLIDYDWLNTSCVSNWPETISLNSKMKGHLMLQKEQLMTHCFLPFIHHHKSFVDVIESVCIIIDDCLKSE